MQLLAQDKVPRQELYKDFIEAATQCYADALQHEKPDIPGLVNLYGKIGRMRVLSSPKVLASAEQIGQKIINMYLEPNKTFFELREMVNKNAIDILGNFGEACREELRSLHMFQPWPIGGGHRKKFVSYPRFPTEGICSSDTRVSYNRDEASGTHGRRGGRYMMLGSVAEGLIRVATKPVLLIRGR